MLINIIMEIVNVQYLEMLNRLKVMKKELKEYERKNKIDTIKLKRFNFQSNKVVCPCCKKEMTTTCYYVHKKSDKYRKRETANGKPFISPVKSLIQ